MHAAPRSAMAAVEAESVLRQDADSKLVTYLSRNRRPFPTTSRRRPSAPPTRRTPRPKSGIAAYEVIESQRQLRHAGERRCHDHHPPAGGKLPDEKKAAQTLLGGPERGRRLERHRPPFRYGERLSRDARPPHAEATVDTDRVLTFIHSTRNPDGGYGIQPDEPSAAASTYYAAIVQHLIDDKQVTGARGGRWIPRRPGRLPTPAGSRRVGSLTHSSQPPAPLCRRRPSRGGRCGALARALPGCPGGG